MTVLGHDSRRALIAVSAPSLPPGLIIAGSLCARHDQRQAVVAAGLDTAPLLSLGQQQASGDAGVRSSSRPLIRTGRP
jgi:hypothetical protein